MAAIAPKSVEEYIAARPKAVQEVLERVRNAIRKALPDAEEGVSYKMPAYTLNGSVVVYFAAWKQHYSLYPANQRLVVAFEDELKPYEVGKGTIRFALSDPVPVALIRRIAKFRANEVAAQANVRSGLKPRGRSTKARAIDEAFPRRDDGER